MMQTDLVLLMHIYNNFIRLLFDAGHIKRETENTTL